MCWAIGTLTVLGVIIGATWALPRKDVAIPDDDATPVEVVRAYVEALNARDFATSNQLWSPPQSNGLFSRPGGYENVEITGVYVDDDLAGWERTINVALRHGPEDGAELWGFWLSRRDGDGAWRIVAQGVA
ncbi:hypothetical protein [Mumia zhuanghuii]|uniref:DUF4864 domain-containing protein n=1 Tax=Mumia zhuanghuii TaxID=2585211 RepID=A0A5C4MIY9_9ACTN|nr:hypothetical protein [Mumia zhuanghuii]TNC36498.1 hypothetical protein FHE65_25980 [Mumia zhuanghuii]TNC44978.1 hypothetical protein FHE65_16290 [Mumia zhuanghuii]